MLQDRLFANEKITVLWDHQVEEFVLEGAPEGLVGLEHSAGEEVEVGALLGRIEEGAAGAKKAAPAKAEAKGLRMRSCELFATWAARRWPTPR